jgi:hypothetical protein
MKLRLVTAIHVALIYNGHTYCRYNVCKIQVSIQNYVKINVLKVHVVREVQMYICYKSAREVHVHMYMYM